MRGCKAQGAYYGTRFRGLPEIIGAPSFTRAFPRQERDRCSPRFERSDRMNTVRDYVQDWVRRHAAPDADTEALTANLCEEAVAAHPLIDAPNFPLTPSIREQLDDTFGTNDDEDAQTPAAVTRDELRGALPPRCADRLGRPVAPLVLNEHDVGWDAGPTDPLPKILVERYRTLLRDGLTDRRLHTLRAELC